MGRTHADLLSPNSVFKDRSTRVRCSIGKETAFTEIQDVLGIDLAELGGSQSSHERHTETG
jgi:hypothetical protein